MNKPMIRFEGYDEDWESKLFNKDMFSRLPTSKYQIMTGEYKDEGLYPIVDQGKDLVVGYYDNADNLLNVEDDVIVFGDHTRLLKYINFDFVPGADGIQVIKPTKNYNTLFLYNRLTLVAIPDVGYSRHFKFLNNQKLNVPELEEQEQIGNFFKTLDELLSAEEEQLQNYEQYKSAMLQKMFPRKGETNPEIRFSGFDEDWKEFRLSEVVNINESPDHVNDWYLEIGDIDVTHRTYTLDINKSVVKGAKPAKRGTILLSTVRPTRGAITILKDNCYVSSGLLQLHVDNVVKRDFIYQILSQESFFIDLGRLSTGSTYPTVNKRDIMKYKITAPSDISEQQQIGQFFKSLDNRIEAQQKKVNKLKEAKEAFLQKMFV